jgi:hypothetical protein
MGFNEEPGMSFLPAERFIITLIAMLAGLDICLIKASASISPVMPHW